MKKLILVIPVAIVLLVIAVIGCMQAEKADAQAEKETQKWPYSWVTGVDYPLESERSTVSGKIVLKLPYANCVGDFHEGLSGFMQQQKKINDSRMGFIDKKGTNRIGYSD